LFTEEIHKYAGGVAIKNLEINSIELKSRFTHHKTITNTLFSY